MLVELNAVNASAVKSSNAYKLFKDACPDLGKPISITDDIFKLNFNEGYIPKGSYKLTLTFGTAESGTIKADAKPVSLTVKAAVPKKIKGSYKAATSYQITAAPGQSVVLTGTGKQIKSDAVYYELLASNVKGKPNKFLEYFELSHESNDTVSKLKLKDSLTQEQIQAIAKDDLTGYVTYRVSYGDDGYGHPTSETKTVKLTIKLN